MCVAGPSTCSAQRMQLRASAAEGWSYLDAERPLRDRRQGLPTAKTLRIYVLACLVEHGRRVFTY